MEKVDATNLCDCLIRLELIGKIKRYNSLTDTLSNYSDETIDGEICLVSDVIVDNGDYDEEFNFISDIHINQELFKIEYCPICGKRIIYEHKDDAQLKLKI